MSDSKCKTHMRLSKWKENDVGQHKETDYLGVELDRFYGIIGNEKHRL